MDRVTPVVEAGYEDDGRLQRRTLVVLQPTSFCNLDCTYCYLPDRTVGARMSDAVLRATFETVLSSRLVEDPVVFLWHLGEPLAAGVAFYENAFALAADAASRHGRRIRHGFQTNAVLVTDAWTRLIKEHRVRVGVSIDGPAFLHDRVRVDRRGHGTHANVMRGIGRLREAGIALSTISVLTDATLDHPDEFYDFFLDNELYHIGYNVEEVEGVHTATSLSTTGATGRYEKFLAQLLRRNELNGGRIKIREVWTALASLAFGGGDPVNTTNRPFSILNVDRLGNVSTFCPELVTARKPNGDSFAMGNVLSSSLADMARGPAYRTLADQVAAGVRECRATCDHWSFCGGGSPANKFFETGRFDVSETRTCRLHKKATVDVLLRHLEQRAGSARP